MNSVSLPCICVVGIGVASLFMHARPAVGVDADMQAVNVRRGYDVVRALAAAAINRDCPLGIVRHLLCYVPHLALILIYRHRLALRFSPVAKASS